jgi:hypothetical protein
MASSATAPRTPMWLRRGLLPKDDILRPRSIPGRLQTEFALIGMFKKSMPSSHIEPFDLIVF